MVNILRFGVVNMLRFRVVSLNRFQVVSMSVFSTVAVGSHFEWFIIHILQICMSLDLGPGEVYGTDAF